MLPALLETDVLLDEAGTVGEEEEGQVIKTVADRQSRRKEGRHNEAGKERRRSRLRETERWRSREQSETTVFIFRTLLTKFSFWTNSQVKSFSIISISAPWFILMTYYFHKTALLEWIK